MDGKVTKRVFFNEIEYDLDIAALTEAFDIAWFKIEKRRDSRDDRFARALSAIRNETGTSMVRSGSGYLLLLDKGRDVFEKLERIEGVRCSRQSAALLERYDCATLVRALIRALPTAKRQIFEDAAIGMERGLYYVVREVREGRAVKSLRIDLESHGERRFLTISQQTFLRADLVPKKKKKKRPAFRIDDAHIFLDLGVEGREEKVYYMGVFGRKWGKDIPFYDEKDYRRCKIGVLTRFMADFNRAFEGICSIRFVTGDPASAWRRKRKIDCDTLCMAKRYPDIRWNLVAVEKGIDASSIEKMLPAVSGKSLAVSDAVDPEAFNLLLHYDKERYGDGEDPYLAIRRENQDANISSITPRTIADKGLDKALEVVSKEAVIKEDIRRGKLSAPWVGKEIVFGFSFFMNEKKKLPVTHLLRIDKKGDLSHASSFPSPEKLDGLLGSETWVVSLVEKGGYGTPFCCDIERKEWFLIDTLPKFPMPNPDRLHLFHDELEYTQAVNKESFPRSKKIEIAESFCRETAMSPRDRAMFMKNVEEKWIDNNRVPSGKYGVAFRNHLLERHGLRYSTHGLKGSDGIFGYMEGIYFNKEDVEYYVGTSGSVKQVIKNNARVRKVITNAESIPDWFFDLMEVGFVKNKELTVLPYPFKYLKECILRWYVHEPFFDMEGRNFASILSDIYE